MGDGTRHGWLSLVISGLNMEEILNFFELLKFGGRMSGAGSACFFCLGLRVVAFVDVGSLLVLVLMAATFVVTRLANDDEFGEEFTVDDGIK